MRVSHILGVSDDRHFEILHVLSSGKWCWATCTTTTSSSSPRAGELEAIYCSPACSPRRSTCRQDRAGPSWPPVIPASYQAEISCSWLSSLSRPRTRVPKSLQESPTWCCGGSPTPSWRSPRSPTSLTLHTCPPQVHASDAATRSKDPMMKIAIYRAGQPRMN